MPDDVMLVHGSCRTSMYAGYCSRCSQSISWQAESAKRMSGAFKTNLDVCWTPESDGAVGQIVHQPCHLASGHDRVPETDGKRGLRHSTLAGHLDHLRAYDHHTGTPQHDDEIIPPKAYVTKVVPRRSLQGCKIPRR